MTTTATLSATFSATGIQKRQDARGRDIGRSLVREGYARGQGAGGKLAELAARFSRAGLWAQGGIASPARWRRRQRIGRVL